MMQTSYCHTKLFVKVVNLGQDFDQKLFPSIFVIIYVLHQAESIFWKLIHYIEEGETELYNLADDEGERNDLAETSPERTREMLATLNKWIEETREGENN